jgi:hypothetical protein
MTRSVIDRDRVDTDHLVGFPIAAVLLPVPHRAAERGADKAMRAFRIVIEADFERDHAALAQIDAADDAALLPVPEMELPSVLAGLDVLQVKAAAERLGGGPFAADHHVAAGLIPEVVIELHSLLPTLPAAGNVELLVQDQEPARPVPFGVAKHREHDRPIRQAVYRVGRGEVDRLRDLFRFDHLVQLGRPRVRRVNDMNSA